MRASRTAWPVLAVLCVVLQHTVGVTDQHKQHPLRQQHHQVERSNNQWIPSDDVQMDEAVAYDGETVVATCNATEEAEALAAINEMEATLQPLFVASQEANWLDNTNQTDESAAAANDANTAYSLAYAEWWKAVINCYEYTSFDDPKLKRRFMLQATPGTTVLPEEDQTKLNTALSRMNALSLQKICPFNKMDSCTDDEKKTMDELEVVLATERDPEALVYYWEAWRDTAGAPAKDDYVEYVRLMNLAAVSEGNNFSDASEMWLQPYVADAYTTDNFKTDIEELWNNMKGLYIKLHAYVRHRLRTGGPYADSFVPDSPIPAHILGNMWAQSWENIYDLVVPYEEVELLDISDALQDNITSVDQMFGYAENFFVETGLYPMTETFWNKSMREQPINVTAVCHASAWDFLSLNSSAEVGPQRDGDFRIKMCTDKNQEDFIVIHHEMGHTQYQMAYSQENDSVVPPPLIFRDGANPGFHEAIGDTIALSVSTPRHLQGLYENITGQSYDVVTNVTKRNINQLMKMALAKVAFIPYAYILDQFRWKVFNATYPVDEMNYYWWDLRVKVQGLKPPILRHRNDDFDPGCKFHVANGIPYIRYFVAHILQFQFHERLCEIGNIPGDVFECDIYQKKAAGEALKELLQRGASDPWTDQLGDFMGTKEGRMNSSSIKAYFQPLEDYLDGYIKDNKVVMKWSEEVDKYFVAEIPAIVPIVVGCVLAFMIVVVVVAFFIGKKRQDKKQQTKDAVLAETGKANPAFKLEESKTSRSSSSSAGS